MRRRLGTKAGTDKRIKKAMLVRKRGAPVPNEERGEAPLVLTMAHSSSFIAAIKDIWD